MNKLQTTKPVYAITDYQNLTHDEVLHKTDCLLKAGIDLIQYRNKHASFSESKRYASDLYDLCEHYDALLMINDRIDLLNDIDAAGLHIGKDDIALNDARKHYPDKIIGVSCYNNLNTAIEAENNGADYIAFGAFFSTSSKSDTVTAPITIIQEAKKHVTVPIVGIGGITPENAKPLITNGIDYIAAISGLYGHSDPYSAAKHYLSLFKKN